MKIIRLSQVVNVPKEVDVRCKHRLITVKGPRGTLKRSFRSLQIDIQVL